MKAAPAAPGARERPRGRSAGRRTARQPPPVGPGEDAGRRQPRGEGGQPRPGPGGQPPAAPVAVLGDPEQQGDVEERAAIRVARSEPSRPAARRRGKWQHPPHQQRAASATRRPPPPPRSGRTSRWTARANLAVTARVTAASAAGHRAAIATRRPPAGGPHTGRPSAPAGRVPRSHRGHEEAPRRRPRRGTARTTAARARQDGAGRAPPWPGQHAERPGRDGEPRDARHRRGPPQHVAPLQRRQQQPAGVGGGQRQRAERLREQSRPTPTPITSAAPATACVAAAGSPRRG